MRASRHRLSALNLPAPSPEALRTAAGRLVASLAAHDDDEYRLTVLRRLARRLGDDGYPLFLRLLTVVAESDDTDAKRVLRSVQDRVASLATIYKNLYQAEHLESVEADRLIRDIIGQMSTASVVNDQSIQVDTQLEPLVLLPDQAVPLTLLTTEAFTNALKYAFPDGRPGSLRLTLEPAGAEGMP